MAVQLIAPDMMPGTDGPSKMILMILMIATEIHNRLSKGVESTLKTIDFRFKNYSSASPQFLRHFS